MKTVYSKQKDRENWRCEVDIMMGRAIGKMYQGDEVVREGFNVKCEYGEFSVDIGTGSGVKVKFQVEQ